MKNNKIKKAGIYDRWLHALGGGEQVAFAYAVALRDLGYKTDLITHKEVDLRLAEGKMNVDLRGINIRYIPNLLDYQLSSYTQDYDVFVCNSYLDYIPNLSKFGILSIFFPSRIKLFLYEYLKRAYVVPSLKRFFIYPSQFEGFLYDEFIKGKIYKWLGKKSTIIFSQNIFRFQIELYFDQLAFSCIDQLVFKLGNKTILPKVRTISLRQNTALYSFETIESTKGVDFSIYLPDSEFSNEVALTRIIIPSYRYIFYNQFKKFFPRLEMRLHGGPSVTKYSDVESYDKILAISRFSQKWIKKYWGLDSRILYPPVSSGNFYPSKHKKNIIVHIGRFFVTGHSKKQLDLARCFKQLVDDGIKNWELHFIGSVAEGDIHYQYLNTVKEESQGYPIFFHIGAPFTELRDILSRTKIYWHATGLEEDPERNPIKLEHFGITTVEAMASGCVPVVIGLGGQAEIVTPESGFLWKTREELIAYTKQLILDQKLWEEKSKNAIERSKFFSLVNFKKQLSEYLPKEKAVLST